MYYDTRIHGHQENAHIYDAKNYVLNVVSTSYIKCVCVDDL